MLKLHGPRPEDIKRVLNLNEKKYHELNHGEASCMQRLLKFIRKKDRERSWEGRGTVELMENLSLGTRALMQGLQYFFKKEKWDTARNRESLVS